MVMGKKLGKIKTIPSSGESKFDSTPTQFQPLPVFEGWANMDKQARVRSGEVGIEFGKKSRKVWELV